MTSPSLHTNSGATLGWPVLWLGWRILSYYWMGLRYIGVHYNEGFNVVPKLIGIKSLLTQSLIYWILFHFWEIMYKDHWPHFLRPN